MRANLIRRAAAIVAVAAAVAVVAGGASASAAAHSHAIARPAAMRSPRALAMLAARGGMLPGLARLLPGSTATGMTTVSLFTDSVPVTIAGIAYQMSVDVQRFPAGFGVPPQLSVNLARTASAGGRLTGEQAHEYFFAPRSGLHFSATSSLRAATLRTGASILPSAAAMRFHATGPVTSMSCTLASGGTGKVRMVHGTLAVRRFKVVTGTSPFFGTVRIAPRTATLVRDPGCGIVIIGGGSGSSVAGSGGGRGGSGGGAVFHEPCTGNSIQRGGLTSFWASELGFGGRRLLQLGVSEAATSRSAGVAHLVVGFGAGADMHRPVRTADGGIRARVLTSGIPFMGGSAVFHSTAKPRVSSGHACTWERHTHHFTTRRYSGTLTSATSPLELLFDTGTQVVTPTRATLYVRTYLD